MQQVKVDAGDGCGGWAPVGALVLLVCCALPSVALAHRKEPQRAVTLQMDAQGFAALWQVELGGPEAALLRSMQDSDRDGQLDTTERDRLAGVVLARMLNDVKLSADGAALQYRELQAVLADIGSSGTLKVVGFGALAAPPHGAWTLGVGVTRGPLEIVVQGLDGWRADTSPQPQQIAAGESLVVLLSRIEQP